MSTPASPEQFLREFYTEMSGATYSSKDDFDKKLRGWAKLLRLREDAARVDELHKAKDFNRNIHGGVIDDMLETYMNDRIAELTTPNNTSNILEDEVKL